MGKANRSKHSEQLTDRALHPDIVGINKKNLVFIAREGLLLSDGKLIGEPDLVFLDISDGLTILEHKVNNSPANYQRAREQLLRARRRFEDLEYSPHLIYSYTGGYKILK